MTGSPFYNQFQRPHDIADFGKGLVPETKHPDKSLDHIRGLVNEALEHLQHGDIIQTRDVLEEAQMELG